MKISNFRMEATYEETTPGVKSNWRNKSNYTPRVNHRAVDWPRGSNQNRFILQQRYNKRRRHETSSGNLRGSASRELKEEYRRSEPRDTNAPWCRRAPADTVASCRYLSVGLRRACYVLLRASNGRRAAARERASKNYVGAAGGRLASPCLASPRLVSPRLTSPRLVSSRLASPREGKKMKRGRRCCRTRWCCRGRSDGLPTSPRARNSVTVRAVDIVDAYSMSDGSSPGERRGRKRMPAGRGRRVGGFRSRGQVRF